MQWIWKLDFQQPFSPTIIRLILTLLVHWNVGKYSDLIICRCWLKILHKSSFSRKISILCLLPFQIHPIVQQTSTLKAFKVQCWQTGQYYSRKSWLRLPSFLSHFKDIYKWWGDLTTFILPFNPVTWTHITRKINPTKVNMCNFL